MKAILNNKVYKREKMTDSLLGCRQNKSFRNASLKLMSGLHIVLQNDAIQGEIQMTIISEASLTMEYIQIPFNFLVGDVDAADPLNYRTG